MVQFRHPLFRRPHAIHYLALPWRKPRDDATCLHRFPPEPHPSFEAQTQKPSTSGFEAQPTKPSMPGFEAQTSKPPPDGFEAQATKPPIHGESI